MRLTKEHIGMEVRRVSGEYCRGAGYPTMRVGDEDIIEDVSVANDVTLKRYGKGHSLTAFEIVVSGTPTTKQILVSHLKKGDILEAQKDICSDVKEGSKHEFVEYDSDGDMVLRGLQGVFTTSSENWKPVGVISGSIMAKPFPRGIEVSEGDWVIMTSYGWGIGEHHVHVKLFTPYQVAKVHERGYVQLDVSGAAGTLHLSPRAYRIVKKDKPMFTKKIKKEPKGVVSEYKGLVAPIAIEDQKGHAQRVLSTFKAKHKASVWVCGGAPRNWDHGKLANDIDVYLYNRGNVNTCHAHIAYCLGIEKDQIIQLGSSSAYYGQPGIKFVFQVELAGQEYQFIVVRDPIADNVEDVVLAEFNCDICKIAWNPLTDRTKRTPEYKTDKEFKRLTYRMYALETWNAEQSMYKHVPKMMKQFPEHTVMILQSSEDHHSVSTHDDPFRY